MLPVKDHVFEPFFTTKKVGEGSGLGLSTCYGIIVQSGGYITLDSRLGGGTTFLIFLPKCDEPSSHTTVPDEAANHKSGHETILLVEDEPMVRAFTATVLRDRGYTVIEASNGLEALRTVQERADEMIHLLLADVVMPLMGGTELSEQAKTLQPEIKVLLTSGYTGDAIIRYGVFKDHAEFLQKPFTSQNLVHKVRSVLDNHR
jgi:CheY-like chemotaxis protein